MTNNSWLQLEIIVPAPAIDLVCDALANLGCSGTLVEKRELDTFTVPDDEFSPDEDVALQAYFPESSELAALKEQIQNALAELRPLFPNRQFQLGRDQQVKQEDWAEGWKQHFTTLHIGERLIIRPSWEKYQMQGDEKVLELDPGMAFGTGSHGTTLLCLHAIVELFDGAHPPQSLLDVGTGSGILAMAASVLGASKVVACDIDPLACDVAAENCQKNMLTDKIDITTDLLEQIPGHYDVVVANILAEENIRLADQLAERLADDGYLFLSGILQEKEALVKDAFAKRSLKFIKTTRQDEWVCLIWKRGR